MIFLTVGTQLPFDRLVNVVNEFSLNNPAVEIFGQIGKSSLENLNFPSKNELGIEEFNFYFDRADIIVGHAGMGTILSAMTGGKPLFMMARQEKYGEHRNDHQLGTLERFKNNSLCFPFDNEKEFNEKYINFSKNKESDNGFYLSQNAPDETIENLSLVVKSILG